MRGIRAWLAIGVVCGVVACDGDVEGGGASDPNAAETRQIMREIFANIRVALVDTAGPDALRDPATRTEVAAAVDQLNRMTDVLERHTSTHDPQTRFLARSISRDARDVERQLAAGNDPRAIFLLRQITENCIVCHTRIQSGGDSLFTEHFVSSEAMQSLDPGARASLQMATRQFEGALATLEQILASTRSPALMMGPITDYLVISIRVKDDFRRPLPVLERFAKRPDLWARLRADVEVWVDALPKLARRAQGVPDLETARALLRDGNGMTIAAGDHAPLVHYVTASAILEKLIEANPPRSRDLGEAYFLLGIVEARIGRNYWVTPAPFLLETSIRIAPSEPFARDAFAILERELLMRYEGSEIEALPAEDKLLLDELAALIDAG